MKPDCLVHIRDLLLTGWSWWSSYLNSLSLVCPTCSMGFIIALASHVGRLSAPDQCMPWGKQAHILALVARCLLHSVSCPVCAAVWGTQDIIHMWQFINQKNVGQVPGESLVRADYICLIHCAQRAQSRWLHFAEVCTRWTLQIWAHLLRTPQGLSWPPWDSCRTLISCARSSVSCWRQSAPMWKYVLPFLLLPIPAGPISLPSSSSKSAAAVCAAFDWHKVKLWELECQRLSWNVKVSLWMLRKHDNSYNNKN